VPALKVQYAFVVLCKSRRQSAATKAGRPVMYGTVHPVMCHYMEKQYWYSSSIRSMLSWQCLQINLRSNDAAETTIAETARQPHAEVSNHKSTNPSLQHT
jgi:hypothetical protein